MPVATKNYEAPATDRQIAFIAKLAAERNKVVDAPSLTRKQASDVIERLLDIPKPVAAKPTVDPSLEANTFHAVDGEFYRVVANQWSGALYAQKWNAFARRFGKAPRAIFLLSAATLATQEQAAQFGQQFGVCGICGRTLTDPPSVARGIGPVCLKRLGWAS